MFITKSFVSRRTVLRGIGATLSLPLLDAMVPALTPTALTAATPTKRFGDLRADGRAPQPLDTAHQRRKIGRASCRERV